jgi:hypothetical protein
MKNEKLIGRFVPCIIVLAAFFICACAADDDVPKESKPLIKEYWNLYLQNDPGWPEAKEKWIAMGEKEEMVLVNWLIQEIRRNAVKTYYTSSGVPRPGWLRPVQELKSLGDKGIPSLLEALEILRDETTVYPCILALAEMADYTVMADTFDRASRGDHFVYQSRLVKVLARIDDPRAIRKVLAVLNGAYDWRVRATAVDAVEEYEGALSKEVAAALEEAAWDEDTFIATKAKKALSAIQRR